MTIQWIFTKFGLSKMLFKKKNKKKLIAGSLNEVNVKRKRKFWTDFWMKCNSRAAVVRGKVVSASGLGLFGVRVSSANAREGFTLTRDDGIFDLMVNGGAAVVIHFGRTPFKPRLRTVNVPWNEVITFLFFIYFLVPFLCCFYPILCLSFYNSVVLSCQFFSDYFTKFPHTFCTFTTLFTILHFHPTNWWKT